MSFRFAALSAISALLPFPFAYAAPPQPDDPADLLVAARERVRDTMHQLPKYVCTLTVDRKRYAPPDPEYGTDGLRRARSCEGITAEARQGGLPGQVQRQLLSADRLRLDVAVMQDSAQLETEMYSWAGENRFTGRDLFDFVRGGAISTGSFASLLASIFANPSARFSYAGDSVKAGRALSKFDFHVPRDNSQYSYIFGEELTGRVIVGYDGALLFDPANADLVHLSVHTEQLPAETGACQVTQELTYTHVRLRGSDFLLPAEANANIIHTDGSEADNQVQYTACHEFAGDASVRFNNPRPEKATPPEEALPSISLPSGLPFQVALTDHIDAANAAAGDAIHGRLKTAIKDRSGKVLAAEGAPVTGRIMRIQRDYNSGRTLTSGHSRTHLDPTPSLVIGIRLETLDAGKGPQPFQAVFDTDARRPMKRGDGLRELHDRPRDFGTATFAFWDNDPDHAVETISDSDWVTGAP